MNDLDEHYAMWYPEPGILLGYVNISLKPWSARTPSLILPNIISFFHCRPFGLDVDRVVFIYRDETFLLKSNSNMKRTFQNLHVYIVLVNVSVC